MITDRSFSSQFTTSELSRPLNSYFCRRTAFKIRFVSTIIAIEVLFQKFELVYNNYIVDLNSKYSLHQFCCIFSKSNFVGPTYSTEVPAGVQYRKV